MRSRPDPTTPSESKSAVELRRVRAEALKLTPGGLRAVYRTLELPGKHPLKDAHAHLDSTVLNAYNFSPSKDLLAQLLELNLTLAAMESQGKQPTAPGIPSTYPNSTALITTDCISPTLGRSSAMTPKHPFQIRRIPHPPGKLNI